MKHFSGLLVAAFVILITNSFAAQKNDPAAGRCMTCHKEISPGLYRQWYESAHAVHNVTCLDCHGAARGEADAFDHYDAVIATLVSPKDCGACHEREMKEVDNSHHAKAGLILESQDAYLAHVTAGHPAVVTGCESCHGAYVQISPESRNKLSRNSWPNSGIGRINPDGTKGSCNACHTRHSFSKAQARQPEACSKCHLGPDHPQKEIYEESKHGNTYYTNIDKMNLSHDRWVVGEDYFAAPTCATCHISATGKVKISHDVGRRISWTLRPVFSEHKENWRENRENMMGVCRNCHGNTFIDGHFFQYDANVNLYNAKFARPATDIMNMIRKKGLLENKADFGNDVEWTYWELWHHEGRRARHGAAMMGPDYTWWHGFYEVAKHFYFNFIPEAREYGDSEINQYIDSLLANDPMHRWISRPAEDLKKDIRSGKMQEYFRDMFNNQKN